MIFRKEFLPINELQGSWWQWDKCSMEGISLNQYIFNYYKLKVVNEFQIFWGFMRGLNPNYEACIELKQPKDLVEALKYAQICNDITRRSKAISRKGKDNEMFRLKEILQE